MEKVDQNNMKPRIETPLLSDQVVMQTDCKDPPQVLEYQMHSVVDLNTSFSKCAFTAINTYHRVRASSHMAQWLNKLFAQAYFAR